MSKNMQQAMPTILAGVVIVGLVVAGGWVALRATAPEPGPRTVVVFADQALRTVMDDIVNAFQRRSDVRIDVRYGAPSNIAGSGSDDADGANLFVIQGAAPLHDAGDRLGAVETVAWVLPVILVRDGNPEEIGSVADLAREGLAIGVAGAETSELGRMTPEILAELGADMDAIAPNIALTSTTDAELGNAVRMGRIDAALVWEPMAHGALRTDIVPLLPSEAIAAPVSAAIASQTRNDEAAREFLAFLKGRAAQNIFERYHFAIGAPQ